MRVLAIAIVSLLVLSGCAKDFSAPWPPGIPDMTSWEYIEGEIVLEKATFRYRLYVDPERKAMYAVARYRISPHATSVKPRVELSEKIVWHEARHKTHYFQLTRGRWTPLSADELAYESNVAGFVYSLPMACKGHRVFKHLNWSDPMLAYPCDQVE